MRPARVEIAAPGSLPTFVVRAPFATVPESKRAPRIEKQEQFFLAELKSLEDSTKKRNREFYRLLESIEERGRSWEAKLEIEEAEQKKSHDQLVKIFEDSLSTTIFLEKKAIVSDIERFHTEKIPPQEFKMAESEQGVEVYVGETIPLIVDRQSGIVSRKLQKAHDTFDVMTR